MKFPHVIVVCCFSALCLEASEVLEVSGHVGGEVSIHCSGRQVADNSSEHSRMYFCKEMCSKNVLIQTKRRRSVLTQQNRFYMEVDRRNDVFIVTIKELERMDAGRYQCGVEKANNKMHQEVSLLVLDAATVLPGFPPSAATALQPRSDALPQGNFLSSTEPSTAPLTLPSSEKKRNLRRATNLTDTTVVIIVSGSLALLVCAIIPLIFYGRWRSNSDGHNRSGGNKHEGASCEENADVGLRLQTFQPQVEPESNSHDASQYASIYAALDPKSLDLA